MARRKGMNAPWREDALECVRILRAGGLIVSATDTVWGIACRADDPKALSRMSVLKSRPDDKPFIVLLDEPGMAAQWADDIADSAWDLLEVPEAEDRSITIVLPRAKNLPEAVTAAAPESAAGSAAPNATRTVAVRAVRNAYLQFIIKGLGVPLASTSANRSGDPAPKGFRQIDKSILQGVDFVGRYGRDQKCPPPSSIVRIDESGRVEIVRP
jgi:L-threonylcarbamoyladenylate synthase